MRITELNLKRKKNGEKKNYHKIIKCKNSIFEIKFNLKLYVLFCYKLETNLKSEFICYYFKITYAYYTGESNSNELFPSGFSCILIT